LEGGRGCGVASEADDRPWRDRAASIRALRFNSLRDVGATGVVLV
jgi:hypothetical protein